jgi:hypothetical protein
MTLSVLPPIIPYLDSLGHALQNGSIYIGSAGQIAKTAPIIIYWDRAATQPAAQPLLTINGYISRNGTPGNIFYNGSDYSISILDNQNNVVFQTLSAFGSGFIDTAGGTPIVSVLPSNNLLQNTDLENIFSGHASPLVLTALQKGHDLFLAGAAGVTYSYVSSNNITTITITAGSLTQTFPGKNVYSGEYVLSWTGTAQARINGGTYAVSPIVVSVTGGTDLICEWTTGTMLKPLLQTGNTPTSWMPGINYYLINTTTVANVIINPLMAIVQQPATVATGMYLVDQWSVDWTVLFSDMAPTVNTVNVPTIAQAKKLVNQCIKLLSPTIRPVLAAGDFAIFTQTLEGNQFVNIAQIESRLTFWIQAGLAGTYCVGLANGIFNQSCVLEFNVPVANTQTFIDLAVPATPAAGTWNYTSGAGLLIHFPLAIGSTRVTGNVGIWQAGNFIASTNMVNGASIANGYISITDVNLGPSISENIAFITRDIAEELDLCQRYFQRLECNLVQYSAAATPFSQTIGLPAILRASPNISVIAIGTLGNATGFSATANATNNGIIAGATATVLGTSSVNNYILGLSARF